ncbi:MAG TPA: GAF domain-containing sensor histidine kinase [Patescibacteria group bacterium]|jgi:signal transduction histidine kinase|nr:GAF domain-containing sensor histidine kinase [Patescibacteria group bacterium]
MPTPTANNSNLQELNEEIYKHSLELAVVNKTLSLLKKLYQISLLSLDPASISEKVSETVRVDLNMEIVGVFLYKEVADVIIPYKFSLSNRLEKTLNEQSLKLENLDITKPKENDFFKKILIDKTSERTDNLKQVWSGTTYAKKLQVVNDASHIKTILLYPLVTQDKVIGMLLLGLNRSFDLLSDFEQDSIKSLIDVVAVALDKALLYEELEVANEQLKALDKARAEFISIASHQLRTPPATIKWYVAAILAGDFGPLSDDLKAALQRTMMTNDSQIATIDDLLNASRIERGKLEFFFEENPLEPVVSMLVEQMQPLAQMKGLALEYRKPSEEFPNILMDKEKVRQVINNMVDNAIKYSKTGAIKVVLKKVDDSLVVSVTDNGKGIAQEDVDKLFEKYQRGHDSVTHAEGLGLGMYVAKVIVEQHNGKIWAESPGVGKGSTFSFSLPIHNSLKPTSVDLAKEIQ